jgi:magnesium-transporting ATPase (P-type)
LKRLTLFKTVIHLQAVGEQFRRFANMYFLIVGIIMATGYYSELFESAISPWTTLGPLAFVVSVSLLVEGSADAKRHRSDEVTNNAPCIILRRGDELDADEDAEREKSVLGGKDVVVNLSKEYFQTSNNQGPETPVSTVKSNLASIGFQNIHRMDIRQGHLILVKNRDMVPADMILLASSGDSGSSYIETSSIDGETNLKLRTSPHLPKKMLKHLRDGTPMDAIEEVAEEDGPGEIESIEQATKRVARFSCLAYPDGTSALKENIRSPSSGNLGEVQPDTHYVAALTSEPPNPHVNTFSGRLTLPPVEPGGPCHDIPLGAENILLRGAVVRNTEWVIGLACFTGTDTKLVQNSFDTPSKFSQLDILMNYTVILVIIIMIMCISWLATQAVISNDQEFNNLW